MTTATAVNLLLQRAKYRYINQAKQDIISAVKMYQGLTPKLENVQMPNGENVQLFALDGTVPVTFREKVYHIPVCLYIQRSHPYEPPLCYVRPTANMCIKESWSVDKTGRVYLPYLSDWKQGKSDLLGVIQVMIITFGENPPVYQRPKTSEDTSFQHTNFQSMAYSTADNPTNPFMSSMPPTLLSGPTANTPYPLNSPQYPSAYPFSVTYPASGVANTPYPTSTIEYPTSSYNNVNTNNTNNYSSTISSNVSPSMTTTNTGTITEEHIRASLVSAVEDKIKEKLREKIGQVTAEVDVLKTTQDELNRGKTKLSEIMHKIELEFSELDKGKIDLQRKSTQLTEIIEKHDNDSKNVEIDEAFGPSQPLYKQLVNSFAEENAIADAIYYLGESLRKGVIDLDTFLKNVRELSRRQFMLRALMQKCREKAGLPFR